METQGKLNVEFPDLELLQRFDVPGPRYTSYPTADRFTKEFGAEDFKKVLNARGTGENTADLSLYVHLSVRMSASSAAATKKSRKITVDPKSIWKF
jgi:oxygen-independent coproporphyrinogen-3 oxidase